MVSINKKPIIFRIALLLGLGISGRLCSLQAMNKERDDTEEAIALLAAYPTEKEVDAMVRQMATLAITKKKTYHLFAQDCIRLDEKIKNFETFDQEEKKKFLKRFMNIAHLLAKGTSSVGTFSFDCDRLTMILKLGQRKLQHIVGYLGEEKKKIVQEIDDKISNKTLAHAGSENRFSIVKALLNFCHQELRILDFDGGKSYIELLQLIFEYEELGAEFESVFLFELLRHCDPCYKNKNETWNNSLSLINLRNDIRKLYGYEIKFNWDDESVSNDSNTLTPEQIPDDSSTEESISDDSLTEEPICDIHMKGGLLVILIYCCILYYSVII